MENITFRQNQNFETLINGHFAKVTVVQSTFEQNMCKLGVFTLAGMEKEMIIFSNRFVNNVANHVVRFETDSQSEILGQVSAYFVRNYVKFNRANPTIQQRTLVPNMRVINNATYEPRSYAIGLKGLQKVNVTNNLFGENQMEYELLAGIKTARMDNVIKVIKNW